MKFHNPLVKTAKEIRHGYTGGAVDMYIPRPPKGTKIFCYDVNSLYPFVMDQFDMPVGKPTQFFGDIRKVDPNAFGFFYCKIITPNNLLHPILQTHVKVNKGTRTIAPLGTWEDMIFSEEMDNAVKYGYKFEILWGYKFNRKNIFKGYVGALYKLRTQYPKTNPLNLIAKLLLNSLYGRFGMDDSFANVTIFDTFEEFKLWFKDHNEDVIQFEELGNKVMVQHRSDLLNEYTDEHGNLETHNVSIGIAAAVTAYARIHMSQFKNNPNFILYYSDTDSIYIDRPLPDEFISSTILGKMKLEYVLTDAIFLAPKMYYLQTEDDKVIYKVKGLKHEVDLTLTDFESLLYRESLLEKFQNKWRKNLSEGSIEVKDELYTLRVTNNKRKLIFDENNKLIQSLPFIINEAKEVINKD
jgi:DNA polymerase type B, organellar and viral